MINSSHRMVELGHDLPSTQRTASTVTDHDIEAEFRWQLYTLIGTAASYLAFFVLLTMSFTKPFYAALSVTPLILYDVGKVVFSAIRLREDWDVEGKDDLKNIVECGFMTLYKVTRARGNTQIGVIIKICKKDVDCTYLIAPVALTIIARIVLSMGIYREFNGIYQSVCNQVLTLVVPGQLQNNTSNNHDKRDLQTAVLRLHELEPDAMVKRITNLTSHRPYWLLFAGLFFLSMGSLVISFNSCFCLRTAQPTNYNDIIASIWLSYTFTGFTITSFSLAYLFTSHVEGSRDEMVSGCMIFSMYLLVLLLFTLAAFHPILYRGAITRHV